LPWRTEILDSFITNINWSDFGFHGEYRSSWHMAHTTANSSYRRLRGYYPGGIGLHRWNNCFTNRHEDLKLDGSGGFCHRGVHIQSFISGAGSRARNTYQGGFVHFAGMKSGEPAESEFFGPSADTHICKFIAGSDGFQHQDTDLHADQENIGPNWFAPLVIFRPGIYKCVDPELEGQSQPTVFLEMTDVRDIVKFIDGQMNSPLSPFVIEMRVEPPAPLQIIDTKQRLNSGLPPTAWVEPRFRDKLILFQKGQRSRKISYRGNALAAQTIDWSYNERQAYTLNQALTTFTIFMDLLYDNPLFEVEYTLRLTQDAVGNRLIAFGTAIAWTTGVAPTLKTAANAVDELKLWYDGTKWFGHHVI
jgi:hypothetical protein